MKSNRSSKINVDKYLLQVIGRTAVDVDILTFLHSRQNPGKGPEQLPPRGGPGLLILI